MNIGYARVSTDKQNHDLQIDSLKQAGCEKIYCDTYTGKTKDRPELQTMLDTLRTGDTVIIWRLDRLGRSIKDLIHLMECIEEKERK